jgi:hypothetical protein
MKKVFRIRIRIRNSDPGPATEGVMPKLRWKRSHKQKPVHSSKINLEYKGIFDTVTLVGTCIILKCNWISILKKTKTFYLLFEKMSASNLAWYPDSNPLSSKRLDPDPHVTNADPKHWCARYNRIWTGYILSGPVHIQDKVVSTIGTVVFRIRIHRRF